VFLDVGSLLPYEDGAFAAELILLMITGVAAAMQIRTGLFVYLFMLSMSVAFTFQLAVLCFR